MALFDNSGCEDCVGCAPPGFGPDSGGITNVLMAPVYCVQVKTVQLERRIYAASPWLPGDDLSGLRQPTAGDFLTQILGLFYNTQHETLTGTGDGFQDFNYTCSISNFEGTPASNFVDSGTGAYGYATNSFIFNGPTGFPGGLIGNAPGSENYGAISGAASRSVTNGDTSVWTMDWTDELSNTDWIAALDSAMDTLNGTNPYDSLNWFTLLSTGAIYATPLIGGVPVYFKGYYELNDCFALDQPLDGICGSPDGMGQAYSAADGAPYFQTMEPTLDLMDIPVSLWVVNPNDTRFGEGFEDPLFGGGAGPGGSVCYVQSQVQLSIGAAYAITTLVMMADGSLILPETDTAGITVCSESTLAANTPLTIPIPPRLHFPSALFTSGNWPIGRISLYLPKCTCAVWEVADPWDT